ncbi:MAG TPA: chemotaxis protein CheW [Allosphingosinicella sp.]|jgi:purine-binding chemotaxis protein CheW
MSGHYVVACLAGEWVAFASDEIESVVEIGAIVPVPCAAPHVAGLAALRSRVLTVIDCSASVMPGTATEQPRDALVVVHCGHAYALLVDRVEDALEASGEGGAPPAGLSSSWARIVHGHVFAGERLLLLADIAALIEGPVVADFAFNQPLTFRSHDAAVAQGVSRT